MIQGEYVKRESTICNERSFAVPVIKVPDHEQVLFHMLTHCSIRQGYRRCTADVKVGFESRPLIVLSHSSSAT